jgi:hypothetical protein
LRASRISVQIVIIIEVLYLTTKGDHPTRAAWDRKFSMPVLKNIDAFAPPAGKTGRVSFSASSGKKQDPPGAPGVADETGCQTSASIAPLYPG